MQCVSRVILYGLNFATWQESNNFQNMGDIPSHRRKINKRKIKGRATKYEIVGNIAIYKRYDSAILWRLVGINDESILHHFLLFVLHSSLRIFGFYCACALFLSDFRRILKEKVI